MKAIPLIFEQSVPGRRGVLPPACDVPVRAAADLLPPGMLREDLPCLPELSEVDVVRHFTGLSQRNYGVDAGFYPLGSCTMKYNPKINEAVAALEGFAKVHPAQADESAQGCLELLWRLSGMLAEVTGMAGISLQPAAGAHGELTGLMMIKAYHRHRGDEHRTRILVPDTAHGTNPASAAAAGFEVVQIPSAADGGVDLDALKAALSPEVAGLMLTNPSTLGLFEENICAIAEMVHEAGGLLYYDGANANAILGIVRPGDMGFDVVHLNLHKTFGTPHGGGGPGAGPVGVSEKLLPFLPAPVIGFREGGYFLDDDRPLSIGRVKAFHGNFAVAVRAYAYLLAMGPEGLRQVSETAVLNANYVMHRLKPWFDLPYDKPCMHEAVFSGQRQKDLGVSTLDMAKRLMDYGFHPPTIYFPLIVHEAIMIEPTETESKETLDAFTDAMIAIAKEVQSDPDLVRSAPHTTAITRLDEAKAARTPVLAYAPLCGCAE
jgi:glycine dehydrogenase subunit 2